MNGVPQKLVDCFAPHGIAKVWIMDCSQMGGCLFPVGEYEHLETVGYAGFFQSPIRITRKERREAYQCVYCGMGKPPAKNGGDL